MSRRTFFFAGVLLAGSATALAQSAPPVQPPAPPSGDKKAGRDIYMRYGCFACHGTSGQGGGENVGGGPKLAPDPLPFVAYRYQIRHPRAIMPAYSQKVLSDAQVADTYAYVASIRPGKAAEAIPLLNE